MIEKVYKIRIKIEDVEIEVVGSDNKIMKKWFNELEGRYLEDVEE